jgi:hypothetical protein
MRKGNLRKVKKVSFQIYFCFGRKFGNKKSDLQKKNNGFKFRKHVDLKKEIIFLLFLFERLKINEFWQISIFVKFYYGWTLNEVSPFITFFYIFSIWRKFSREKGAVLKEIALF